MKIKFIHSILFIALVLMVNIGQSRAIHISPIRVVAELNTGETKVVRLSNGETEELTLIGQAILYRCYLLYS